MANKPKNSKKTMDVSKPGKSAPDISARPILTTHQPVVDDPMFVKSESKTSEDSAPVTAKSPPSRSKMILPMSEQEKIEATTETAPESEPTESAPTSAVEPTEAEEKPDTESKPETKEEPETEATNTEETDPESNEEAIVDAVADQVDLKSKKKNDQLTEEEKAKQAALQKLIDEKTYFLPIDAAHHGGGSHGVVIILLLLLALAGAYLTADAGLIDLGVKLPIDIIKN